MGFLANKEREEGNIRESGDVGKGVDIVGVYSSYSVLIKPDLLRQAVALTFVLAQKRKRDSYVRAFKTSLRNT